MRLRILALASVVAALPGAGAQSLGPRIAAARDGAVQFTFAARPGACGDGESFLRDGLGGREGSRIVQGDAETIGRAATRACERGPVRVVLWLADGRATRLRAYVGPVPSATSGARRELGAVPVRDAVAFLTSLADTADGRVASEAVLPLVLADSTTPWPTLLRLAADSARSRSARSAAALWLSRGAAATLGVADADDRDDVRTQAVFALSQLPRDQAVPQLLDVARSSKHADARASALFWLGQTGDRRALALFAEILQAR